MARVMRSIAAMVLLETDDPRLFPENLHIAIGTAAGTEQLRALVVANLPYLTRVVMVTSEEAARLMCEAHAHAARVSGLLEHEILMPPADYRAKERPAPYFPGGRRRRRP